MSELLDRIREGQHTEPLRVLSKRHPVRNTIAILLLVWAGWALYLISQNQRFKWDIVLEYLLAPPVMAGLVVTLWLTAISMAIGLALGMVLAVMANSENYVISGTAALYVWFFRGVPLLVQLVFFYNIAALFPTIEIGIPGVFSIASLKSNAVITPMMAAIIGLGLNEAAFMSEIVRAGIASVNPGQVEAARSLGMSPTLHLTRVVLPQAMRVIIPPTANETVNMLKTTSLVSVLAVTDLMYSVQQIYARNFQVVPLLIVATIWYLVLTTVLTFGQSYLERVFSTRSRQFRGRQKESKATLCLAAGDLQ
jgi:polar amino acid transport system permease protein